MGAACEGLERWRGVRRKEERRLVGDGESVEGAKWTRREDALRESRRRSSSSRACAAACVRRHCSSSVLAFIDAAFW